MVMVLMLMPEVMLALAPMPKTMAQEESARTLVMALAQVELVALVVQVLVREALVPVLEARAQGRVAPALAPEVQAQEPVAQARVQAARAQEKAARVQEQETRAQE